MILTRFAYLPTGTLGRLNTDEGQVQIYTLERAWLGNQRFVSCIPEGEYELAPFNGKRWKGVFELVNVPGRSAILIHPANQPAELAGCIAPGIGWNMQGNTPTVTDSVNALNIVRSWISSGDDTIVIRSERAVLNNGSVHALKEIPKC